MMKLVYLYQPLFFVLLLGCSSNRNLINGENPFYKRGVELRQEGNYVDAVAAFKKCLHHSPESYKANLQLALIYEDHLKDYPNAIVHYRRFIKEAKNSEEIKIAKSWATRAEKKYFEILLPTYGIVEEAEQPVPTAIRTEAESGLEKATLSVKEEKFLIAETKEKLPIEKSYYEKVMSTNILKIPAEKPERAEQTPETYLVQDGDTLIRIAEKTLGDRRFWVEIYDFNREIMESPDFLQIGQRLKIPHITKER